MFEKVSLVEQSILSVAISKIVPVNYDKININILENFYYKNVQNNSEFSYLNNHYNIEIDNNIIWIGDFIRDHYRLKFKKTPLLLFKSGIVVTQGDQISTHHHINEYDLENSPDISALVTCKVGDNPCYVEFDYEQGRKKHQKYRKRLVEKEAVLFNSEIKHRITKNLNHEPTLLLCLKFQLV